MGDALFDKDGQINRKCTFGQLACHVFFVETDTPLAANGHSGMLLGSAGGKEVYMVFRGFGRDNVLDFETMKKLPRHTRKTVYADSCTVPANRLEQYNITFKQIPYEVAGF